MQRETSNDSFLDYGSVYHQPIDREHPELIHQTMVAITRRYVSQFYCFNCDTYLQVKSGIGVLLVSHTAEAADVQEFAMNRLIHIKPNIYFAVVSTTQKLEYDLYAESKTVCLAEALQTFERIGNNAARKRCVKRSFAEKTRGAVCFGFCRKIVTVHACAGQTHEHIPLFDRTGIYCESIKFAIPGTSDIQHFSYI